MASYGDHTEDQVYAQIDVATEIMDTVGSKTPGRSYEQGVADSLNWIIGNESQPPMMDDEE